MGKNAKVVFTNGIFDLLHPGHIALLEFAKSLGDYLIVAINSDRATKLLKGSERPIQNENDRKAALEMLSYVDEVVIFDDIRTTNIVRTLQPHIIVKGSEYTVEQVRTTDCIPAEIEIITCPIMTDERGVKLSTTALIEQMKKDEVVI